MEIDLGKLPFDLDFHPSSPLITAGLITGDLHLYRYVAICFNRKRAAVNRLVNLTETTIASGDDNGCIKVWDTRQRTCCNSFDAHEEYISDMTYAADSLKLLGTSGDGTLSVCSLRKNKVLTQSEFSEDEPLSIVLMKNGRKVICGTQNGVLLLYSWGYFKDCSDRFTGFQSNSIDVLLKLDEDRVITGTENGLISGPHIFAFYLLTPSLFKSSLIGILPNRIIQPIAEHSEYPVERLAYSHDRKFLGSISHDQMLKLWDLDDLLQGSSDVPRSQSAVADSDNDEMDMDMDTNPSTSFKGVPKCASPSAVLSSYNKKQQGQCKKECHFLPH
ncbi:hypothetical protein IFM89_005586 [Coptis chinensis]|uniref:WD repeat-containing protein 55 n=1 Tax=Coptis chinensis TaxID=261450 RepID=A0A835IB49_9MAGN|nr:hypothetical protein IFM89_005586 [Coptis chinensis]